MGAGTQAEAEGIHLNHVEVIPRKNIGTDVYVKKFPLSRGKIPGLSSGKDEGLEGEEGKGEGEKGSKGGIEITETVAIVTVCYVWLF